MRPIDADKVMEEINRIGGHNLCEWDTLGVKALICRQDTLDVAPRAEVARDIFADIEKWFPIIDYPIIAELKKKYTEVESNG